MDKNRERIINEFWSKIHRQYKSIFYWVNHTQTAYLTFILFGIVMSIVPVNSISAQVKDPNLVVIEPFTIDPITINKEVGDLGHNPVSMEYGYVILPPSYFKQLRHKSVGMLVVHTFTGEYCAVELRCPHCFYDYEETHKMNVVSSVPICPSCKAEAQALLVTGYGQLVRYDCGNECPKCMDPYVVEVIRDKRKILLHIKNSAVAVY